MVQIESTQPTSAEPGEAIVVNGLRYVVPYERERIVSVKEKWIGQNVVDILADVYLIDKNGSDTLQKSRKHWLAEVQGGRVAIRHHKTGPEDTENWQWANASPDECMRFKSQVRITEHVHERIVPWQQEGAYDIQVLHADEMSSVYLSL